ncbi:EamA family transporter RarD [Actinomadura sp. DC4]|uniref:EamA family transporter RarD n=1 Tax=Actinomadura sp. DC4 TaxID=3055069 RepID=UPI0025B116D2|nr:EamA family transporter RarD [Actinomadura sp. DC4]MDN3354014.1 EamA family transporter RarD [Actinomadura sp. DC4]
MRRGVLYGITAYVIWGLFPLYWPLLKPAGSIEILAHRIIWSLVAVGLILVVRRHWGWVRALKARTALVLAVAAVLVTINWGTYIYAVNSGHTIEAALGYFINPLVSVLLGVLVLRERLRPWQWAAVGTGTAAVGILALAYGRPPWIALTLACSFGTYGLLKKYANTPSAESLTIETAVLFVPALAYAVFQPHPTFTGHGTGHLALLISGGVITAVPLMLFNSSATRVPLTVLGMLQYLAPVLQFLIGLLVQHEAMPASRWVGFLLVWAALAVFSVDAVRAPGRRVTLDCSP